MNVKILLALGVTVVLTAPLWANEFTDYQQTQAQQSMAASLQEQARNQNSYRNSAVEAEDHRERFELRLMLLQAQMNNRVAQVQTPERTDVPATHSMKLVTDPAILAILNDTKSSQK